jgi:hypothetical protein
LVYATNVFVLVLAASARQINQSPVDRPLGRATLSVAQAVTSGFAVNTYTAMIGERAGECHGHAVRIGDDVRESGRVRVCDDPEDADVVG